MTSSRKWKNKRLKAELLNENEDEPPKVDSRLLLAKMLVDENSFPDKQKVFEDKQDTIIEWFDKTIEYELKKRKERSTTDPSPEFKPIVPDKTLQESEEINTEMSQVSSSQTEIVSQLIMKLEAELQQITLIKQHQL